MNRIPIDINLSALIGKRVVLVCIGTHQAVINLEQGLCISIEGDFSFETGINIEIYSEYRSKANFFVALLECEIVSFEVIDDKTLSFRFTNDKCLIIYDSTDHYESFQIKLTDQLIVV